jgi:hypothetical protein
MCFDVSVTCINVYHCVFVCLDVHEYAFKSIDILMTCSDKSISQVTYASEYEAEELNTMINTWTEALDA